MQFNMDRDWPAVFRGYISRESLANPKNPKPRLFVATMLFVEAGMLELDDQVRGRSEVPKDSLAWAKITRDSIVTRAKTLLEKVHARAVKELKELNEKAVEGTDTRSEKGMRTKQRMTLPPELTVKVLEDVNVSQRCFRERWDGKGAMAAYFMCMVRYACVEARWREVLDHGPQQAVAALPQIRSGEHPLAKLIAEIAAQDLKRWTLLTRCWLFPLLLTMDTELKPVGQQAYRETLAVYSHLWEPVYQAGLAQLGVKLRPDIDAATLSDMISAHISGFALRIAGNGAYTDHDADLFTRSVQAMIYAAIDPGDGRPIPDALNHRLD